MIETFGRPLIFLVVFALAGCSDGEGGTTNIIKDIGTLTSGGSSSAKSPEQKELASRQRAYAQARVTAAGLGGLAGFIGCRLGGCSDEETAAAVVIAATAGYVGGVALTRENEDFKVSQETLQRDLKLAREERQDLTNAASSAQKVLTYQRQEVARLNAGIRNGTVDAAEYRAAYGNMESDVQATRSLISTGTERVQSLNQSITAHGKAGLDTRGLQNERAAQRRELQRLRSVERNMVSVLGAVPAEVRG